MKGRISISEFIHQVKKELIAAQDNKDPFYELSEVTLELSFVLDVTGKTGFKLLVLELGGESKAEQTHKVSLKLTPLPAPEPSSNAQSAHASHDGGAPPSKRTRGGGGGGGGEVGLFGRRGPVYDKVKDP